VAALIRIERRNADEAMDAAFGLGEAVSVFAGDEHGDAFDARGFTRERVFHFDFPTATFSPALIHAHEHAGPIAGFGAAGAGVDAEDAVVFIVRTVEPNAELDIFEFLLQAIDVALKFLLEGGLGFGRLGFAEFDHFSEVLNFLFGGLKRLDFFAEGGGFVDELLGLGLVVPEGFAGHQVVELGEAALRVGDVKETSATA
jgi:hypothetical protein